MKKVELKNFFKTYKKTNNDLEVNYYDDGIIIKRKYKNINNEYFSVITMTYKKNKFRIFVDSATVKDNDNILKKGEYFTQIKVPGLKTSPISFYSDDMVIIKNSKIIIIDKNLMDINIFNRYLSLNEFVDILYENHIYFVPKDIIFPTKRFIYIKWLKLLFWLADNSFDINKFIKATIDKSISGSNKEVIEKPQKGLNIKDTRVFHIYKNLLFLTIIFFIIIILLLKFYFNLNFKIELLNISNLLVLGLIYIIYYFLEKISNFIYKRMNNKENIEKDLKIYYKARAFKVRRYKTFHFYKK